MKYLSCAVLAGLLAVGGCMSDSAPDAKAPTNLSVSETPSYDFPMPAAELVDRVKQALAGMGISVAQQQGSVLITAYKSYPGSFHIMRRWQERTRYRITMSPDSYDPMRRSHLEITSQTQTRASDQDVWHNWAEYQRPQRAAAVAQALHEQIAGSAAASAPPGAGENMSTTPPAPPAPPQEAAAPVPADAETVLVTYHAKAGQEDELAADVSQAWQIYRRDNLVLDEPHVVTRETDATGKTNLVEILSWVSHQAPENVPDAAKKLWDQEQTCCEARAGHPGIDIKEVQLVAPAK